MVRFIAALILVCSAYAQTNSTVTVAGTLCSGSNAKVQLTLLNKDGAQLSSTTPQIYTAGVFSAALLPGVDGSRYQVSVTCPSGQSTQYWMIPDVSGTLTPAQVSVSYETRIGPYYWDTNNTKWASVAAGISGGSGGGVGVSLPSTTNLLKGNGSGGASAAAAGTDFAPATSGASILKANGSGGFTNAVSGVDYAPATNGGFILKGNSLGGSVNASPGVDYQYPIEAGSCAAGQAVTAINATTGIKTCTVISAGGASSGLAAAQAGQVINLTSPTNTFINGADFSSTSASVSGFPASTTRTDYIFTEDGAIVYGYPSGTAPSSATGGIITRSGVTGMPTGERWTPVAIVSLVSGSLNSVRPANNSAVGQAFTYIFDGAKFSVATAGNQKTVSLISGTIASGTATLGTSAISSGACATAVTVSATGVATSDIIAFVPAGDITAVTGYAPSTSGGLAVYPYPSANNVNFKVCNPTSSSITPGAVTLNWRVAR
jgi:hypothetical protein